MTRDSRLPGRLLLAERDALLPILRAAEPSAFTLPTVLPGWCVRDVLAHCAAALTMAATDTLHDFGDDANAADIAARADLPISDVLDELEAGYESAAEAIVARGGAWDALALGEWVHGGDVREAFGIGDAYASAGIDEALTLLCERMAQPSRAVPPTDVRLPDRAFRLGAPEAEAAATLDTDAGTLMRMIAGRAPDPGRYTLKGAAPEAYVTFH
ncbi:maleylpyruvate isomerase family mycothiol-dependent enzyme [Yinghuangia sp. YIM S09857]|uniref:maleylpyruvate isomerase family mycothiol-dependent enzyme n=1 Tax=Yinghuangia sp. YIM S09857 TaxID=3436929 RepID=UPI003F531C82